MKAPKGVWGTFFDTIFFYNSIGKLIKFANWELAVIRLVRTLDYTLHTPITVPLH